jgi:hypothetical protein
MTFSPSVSACCLAILQADHEQRPKAPCQLCGEATDEDAEVELAWHPECSEEAFLEERSRGGASRSCRHIQQTTAGS